MVCNASRISSKIAGSSIVAGIFKVFAVSNLYHDRAQNFARPCFWQAVHHDGQFKCRDRTDLITHHLDAFFYDLVMGAINASGQAQETRQAIGLSIHR